MRCDRSVNCGVCTIQMDYYSTDYEPPGYLIDGPDGLPLRVCGWSCELELKEGESTRIGPDQSFDVRGRVIRGV